MTDYGKLAERLKGMGSPNAHAKESSTDQRIGLAAIYESVKLHVHSEIDKANEELIKRGLPMIERVFLPSYQGRLCLTVGSELLCKVDLHEGKGQITAIITGPPNGYEISRKEFPLTQTPSAAKSAAGYGPRQIAVEIVSGLMMGSFS